MKRNIPFFLFHFLLVCHALAGQATVEEFTPQGEIKEVRQVRVRFSEPMVPFGSTKDSAAPFLITCAAKGTGAWVDNRNWVYNFSEDLKAGVECFFRVREKMKSLANQDVKTQTFKFSTGGPSVLSISPSSSTQYYESRVAEDQIFILQLNGPVDTASIEKNVFFTIDGVANRVPARVLPAAEAEALVKKLPKYERPKGDYVMLQAKSRFPADQRLRLIWGAGIKVRGGYVATSKSSEFFFRGREPFRLTFSCTRENADADCIPFSDFNLSFNELTPRGLPDKIRLTAGGKTWKPTVRYTSDDKRFAREVGFKGPFPELSELTITIPSGIKDDSGRPLENAGKFPLKIKTAEAPPLAKFSARFGIVESKGDPAIPVTLRNLNVASGDIQARLLKISSQRAGDIVHWLKRVQAAKRDKPLFDEGERTAAQVLTVPKPEGAKAFEVVGLPLKDPGLYVIEMVSPRIGVKLLEKPGPFYIPTSALVTNMAVHFLKGAESSLVWVTALDTGLPVAEAAVEVSDPNGQVVWNGKTDASGLARIEKALPKSQAVDADYSSEEYGGSSSIQAGYLVTAEKAGDFSFVHSSWTKGIEAWRFEVSYDYQDDASNFLAGPTVFDRSLFRAGETVHMKHFIRRRTRAGFASIDGGDRPKKLLVVHTGSDQEYPFDLKWDDAGIAETTWKIPKEAKLGHYAVYYSDFPEDKRGEEGGSGRRETSGGFRVEEFRVPLMQGSVKFPATDLVAPAKVSVDLMVKYLSGGGAGGLPVRLRHELRPGYYPSFSDFEDFAFSNGKVKEGLFRDPEYEASSTKNPKTDLKAKSATLDPAGSLRTELEPLGRPEVPSTLVAELEYLDSNGEVQTVSSSKPVWPTDRLVGIKMGGWEQVGGKLKLEAAVVDLSGKPVAGVPVTVDALTQKNYSHRKRLVGGFYGYESAREVKAAGLLCRGTTNAKGLIECDVETPLRGEIIAQAKAKDSTGREMATSRNVWVYGDENAWFRPEEDDRVNVVPEKKHYEPGETANFQVRTPFAEATALVAVEREGVMEAFVTPLSSKKPMISVPVQGNYSPNVYVSALVVRGRVGEVQPTALVDLGRPAFRLGIGKIQVGWRAHELKVKVSADRPVYKIREKARVEIQVTTADGKPLPKNTEVAVAAVDEGLLDLSPNHSWDLLASMMGERRLSVNTSTAQMQVVGRRHYGLKALPPGGGGGKGATRELFDTLLSWYGRVKVDGNGRATVEIPLNDSLTAFRIVAVASGGEERFGKGETTIRSTQDLMILSGVPPFVREGDTFQAGFTVRNTTTDRMDVEVMGTIAEIKRVLTPQKVTLEPGQAKPVAWSVKVPVGVKALSFQAEVNGPTGAADKLKIKSVVGTAVPVRVYQATIERLEPKATMAVQAPVGAIEKRGGIDVTMQPTLGQNLEGVRAFMRAYPFTCLEQMASRAIALRDKKLWSTAMGLLPNYVDGDGLAKYYPTMEHGSDVLTAYLLAISHQAGWPLPEGVQDRLRSGLRSFAGGAIVRGTGIATADLTLRKVAALEALSRFDKEANLSVLSSLTISPNEWPTSTVIDWINYLGRVETAPNRDQRLAEAKQVLKSRLTFQGRTMTFSSEESDRLWWLMVSADENAVRTLLSAVEDPTWKAEVPRLVLGALARQKHGAWDLTTANAWGVLAMEKFSQVFEAEAVGGATESRVPGKTVTVDWSKTPNGDRFLLPWPTAKADLTFTHQGAGKPWVQVQSLAALPLKEALSNGYRIKKTWKRADGGTSKDFKVGDLIDVKLEIDAQSDFTWVVVNDPVPGGSTILGGAARAPEIGTNASGETSGAYPTYIERPFDAFRAYYEYVPKGKFSIEYQIRLNNPGNFELPTTRVEAMYYPEIFGENPNAAVTVK
jgi:uncharacterized protein YfaS (alpha-2-macroglobulin family)